MIASAFAAELITCAWILVMLFADLVVPTARKSSLWALALAGVSLAAAFLMTVAPSSLGRTFYDMFVMDQFAVYFKLLFLATTAVVILMTREFQPHVTTNLGAFYMLLFTALLGMLVVASVNDLLILFIGLELFTFSLYIMAAYVKTDTRSVEAGMKYLILGSISSGFLVYGIALLYGFAGDTGFPALRAALSNSPLPLTAQAGLLLVLAGLGFKVAAVPFNLWVPDVYEGAPLPVVALLSVGSKMAGVVAILRVFYGVFLPLQGFWATALAVLSAVTMLYGNLAAIPQTNIKRLLGYSSIGHAGYLLMGLSSASSSGVEAVGYYLLAYMVSNLTVFLAVTAAADAVGGDDLDRYEGLSKRSPLLAGVLFVGLLSLAGVPPLAGFVGKLLVLLATAGSGHLWLVAIGAVNVAISLYYYLMVIKRMYLGTPSTPTAVVVHPVTAFALAGLVVGILLIGIVQEPFLQQIAKAVHP